MRTMHEEDLPVVVETGEGLLAGRREEGLVAFRGIPFAKPPTGELRFRPPEPPDAWSGVRDASAFGSSAPQSKLDFNLLPGLDVGEQHEGCLYLNVFTPGVTGRRPVMVWIHGGAFTIGSGSQSMYDVRPLARRGDVVVVSINYRLGALGFLHLAGRAGNGSLETGNAGILDQVRALEWVRDNIAAFGGDASNVTIFGESAGGMSVGTLLGTPCAAGLFHRAIAQSGAAHRVNDREQASAVTSLLLERLGLGDDEVRRLWELPVEAILDAQSRLIAEHERHSARRAFCPVVDGRWIPEPPIDAIRGGLSAAVPVLAGVTRDEWRLFGLMDVQASRLDEAGLLARLEERLPGHARTLAAAYRGALPDAAPGDRFFAFETDRVFRIPCIRLLEAQSAHQPRTWAYLMTWASPLIDGSLGACHGVDVPFVMGAIGTRGADRFAGSGPEALRLSERVMDAWIAFARSGDPNHPGLPDWPAYEPGRRATMRLDRVCDVEDDPMGATRIAWEGVL
jgi:para-nitrobenzyl esterase